LLEPVLPVASVVISDCTLREGEQQPGIVLDVAAKVRIATLLARLGVRRAEIGTPAVSETEREAIAEITRLRLLPETIVVCRANPGDIDLAAQCGAWGVVISSPVSPYQLESKLDWSLEEMIGRAVEAHQHAHARGLVSFASAYDTFRTPWRSLNAIYGRLGGLGFVSGLRIVDTVGVARPDVVRRLTRRVRSEFGLPVEAHFHDDFGLAMANAIAAVDAGCESISSSVAGVGERAGNIPTEEIVAALEVLYQVGTGIRLEQLGPVSREIANMLGIPAAYQKAIIGVNAFRHVAGLSVGGYLKDPLVAQPIEAGRVGMRSEIALGKVSGHAAVEHRLAKLGIASEALDMAALLVEIKRWSQANQRLLGDAELLRILKGRAGRGGSR
jgi:isopropylmalate/homocitrate/citramalate synthase